MHNVNSYDHQAEIISFHNFTPNKKFKRLSEKITFLQAGLKEEFGIEKIIIGGGSARAILDYFYFGQDIVMRDVDIFINLQQRCTPAIAEFIGNKFAGTILGNYSQEDLRPRPRVNASGKLYNAGYGFFWITDDDKQVIDLSIFHSDEAIQLNGIFDIDKIKIPLTYPENLIQLIAKHFHTKSLNELIKTHIVEDIHGGYNNWIHRNGKIIEWNELKGNPIVSAIRIVSTYGKLNYQYLPDDVYSLLRTLIKNAGPYNKLQFKRNLMKLITEDRASWMLKNLWELGIIEFYYREKMLKCF